MKHISIERLEFMDKIVIAMINGNRAPTEKEVKFIYTCAEKVWEIRNEMCDAS